ncbi:hypothetical protein MRX96_046115 [Rhipicephalus microplus]
MVAMALWSAHVRQQLADSTNDDDLLRQVKTWILLGWPKQLGQEQQGFLPYFTRRHNLTVKKMDRNRTVNRDPVQKLRFPQGAPGSARQYNQAGQRWLPGTVTASRGKRLVMMDTTGGMQ